MSNAPSVEDVLGGSSLPTASFKNAPNGTYYEGLVVKEEVSQQTAMDKDRTPLFWDSPTNDRPKWQVVVHVQNPAYVAEENPDGILRLFMKSGMLIAGQKSCKDVGIKRFLGAYIRVTQTGSNPTDNGFDQKTYQVDVAPPANPVEQVLAANPQTGELPPQQAPQFQPPQVQQQAPQQFAAPPVQQFAQQAPVQQQFVQPQQPAFPGQLVPAQAPAFAAPPVQQQAPQGFPPATPQQLAEQPQQWQQPVQQAPAQPVFQQPQFAAPPAQPQQDVGAMLQQQLGAVELPQAGPAPQLDPQVRGYVEQLLAAGMGPAEIASNLTGHNFPVTEQQVLNVKGGAGPGETYVG